MKKKRRYVLFIAKGRNGHGLLSVFAHSPGQAREVGESMARPKRCHVSQVWSFRKFAKSVRWFAINYWISVNTKI